MSGSSEPGGEGWRHELAGEGWRRLLARARRRLETTGGLISGSISLPQPTDAERRVVIGVSGSHRSPTAGVIRLDLATLDDWLRHAVGHDLLSTLALVDAAPLRNRPAERLALRAARATALDAANTSRHAGAEWFEAWLAELAGAALTRLVRRDGNELALAVAVLDRLPAQEMPLPVLAESAAGHTKALSGTPLAGLVLRALALWQGVAPPVSAEDERALWDGAGVIVDDLASQVLLLNLPATGGVVASWLSTAAQEGLPFRLTLHQLRTAPVQPVAEAVYVCENPAVLRAAATALGGRSAPLICTEGVASVAAGRLVEACHAAGATVWWRNDFDWPGLRMTASALARFGVRPWRMDARDYRTALGTGNGQPLLGSPAASPWDPGLAVAMAGAGQAVMEERLIAGLLHDLDQG